MKCDSFHCRERLLGLTWPHGYKCVEFSLCVTMEMNTLCTLWIWELIFNHNLPLNYLIFSLVRDSFFCKYTVNSYNNYANCTDFRFALIILLISLMAKFKITYTIQNNHLNAPVSVTGSTRSPYFISYEESRLVPFPSL